nr:hypothetical protein [uncultured Oscillibacter sp.]
MVYLYCKCCQHMAGNTNAAANFYDENFIPGTWKSHYSRLSECAGIILTGHCKACYGDLEELIPIPKGLSGDDLFQAIADLAFIQLCNAKAVLCIPAPQLSIFKITLLRNYFLTNPIWPALLWKH